jgi:hypothetical protein
MARRLLPRLLQPAVVRPAAVPTEKRGVDAIPRNLLNRLVALWTTDRFHAAKCYGPAQTILKSACHHQAFRWHLRPLLRSVRLPRLIDGPEWQRGS